jgi:diaminopimelate epimerase
MRFSKYHGLGNDFVVVDLRTADRATTAAIQEPAIVQAVCDRQFGIGADGVLAILPAQMDRSIARMRVLNADGSEAEMCGNGIRCVVEELHAHGGVASDTMTIETGAGPLSCARVAGGVTVAMGAPRLMRGELPMTGPAQERCISQPIEAKGSTFAMTGVSMGNPHAVIFVEPSSNLRMLAETFGSTLEHHASFPARTNIEFVHVKSRTELEVVVWERGCGITLACGTGACATVVAAILEGHCDEETDVKVNLIGGALAIRVLRSMTNVQMSGPALHVYDGELDPRAVQPRPV